MFSSHSNCSLIGMVDSCGFGKFCCIDGCCTDFTYFMLLLIVISMIVTVAIFIHVEVVKERKFNEKLRKHLESLNKEEYEETRIFLGHASPIETCPFNLPPSCSPPMTVPKLKLSKNRQFLHF